MTAENAPTDPVGRGLRLVRLFHRQVDDFAGLRAIAAAACPAADRSLLDHHEHMTVTMERRHGGPLGLRVVAEQAAAPGRDADGWYAREILLLGPDGSVVQHGIVRMDLSAVSAPVADAIRAGRMPLGRILIDAGLLLQVQRVALLEVMPGPHLRALFAGATGSTHGRVAEIVVNGRPAIELLEIVAPGDEATRDPA